MTTCHEVIDTLSDYIESTLAPDLARALDEHLRDCAPCRQYLATFRETLRALKAAEPHHGDLPPMPESLIEVILKSRPNDV